MTGKIPFQYGPTKKSALMLLILNVVFSCGEKIKYANNRSEVISQSQDVRALEDKHKNTSKKTETEKAPETPSEPEDQAMPMPANIIPALKIGEMQEIILPADQILHSEQLAKIMDTDTFTISWTALASTLEGDKIVLYASAHAKDKEITGRRGHYHYRLESTDGINFSNATPLFIKDIQDPETLSDYKFDSGFEQVIKSGDIWQAWMTRYYTWVNYDGFNHWHSYLSYYESTDGINFTETFPDPLPAQSLNSTPLNTVRIGNRSVSVVKNGDAYQLYGLPIWKEWSVQEKIERQNFTLSTSAAPNAGFSAWHTGDEYISLDGEKFYYTNKIQKASDGTYVMLYIKNNLTFYARSEDGKNFITQKPIELSSNLNIEGFSAMSLTVMGDIIYLYAAILDGTGSRKIIVVRIDDKADKNEIEIENPLEGENLASLQARFTEELPQEYFEMAKQYTPKYSLFSNNEEKARGYIALTDGSIFFKSFSQGGQLLEMRVIFLNNDEQIVDNRVYTPNGEEKLMRTADGGTIEGLTDPASGLTYTHTIPSESSCAQCHQGEVLGYNQEDFSDTAGGELLGYISANCTSCHIHRGWNNGNPADFRNTIAGKKAAIIDRMKNPDAAVAMPRMGTALEDRDTDFITAFEANFN